VGICSSSRHPPKYHEQKTNLAFTLIELLVVISIIALLAGIAAASVLASAGTRRSDEGPLKRQTDRPGLQTLRHG
ncbi:MAG: prepilin-type N-terminal cleavage/methylation domain-containing protein, partial [Chthoniobacterales bacterium]|nr:prepilin-type N-terminal cleavage/methylation domain-containing protein [Chthoniobacterales bacterium]